MRTPTLRWPPARLAATMTIIVLLFTAVAGCGSDDGDDGDEQGDTTTTAHDDAPTALPDFVISSVSVQPSGLVQPGQVQISATVRNMGSADYGQIIVVQAPGNHTGAIIGGLTAGASDVAVIDFPRSICQHHLRDEAGR